jgi:hypothetical protein
MDVDGVWFLSKKISGREHVKHPQDLNLLISTTTMDDATRKLIQRCAKASATPSTVTMLAHLATGEKLSYKQIEHIFEKTKCVVCGE